MDLWQIVVGVAAGLLLLWAALIVVLRIAAPDQVRINEILRLLPDLVRLIAALARDSNVPRRARWLLVGLGAYLALPIDVVPDFIPVLGYADDAIVTALVLRFVIKAAGHDAIARNWRGSPEALPMIYRLAGVRGD